MPSPLSTSSSEPPADGVPEDGSRLWFFRWRSAGLWAVVIVAVVEFFVQPLLQDRFVSHEVDWTLKRIRTTRFDAPVVVLGDSVAHGVFLDWHDRPDTMAMLACSAATETAGQYFLLQRYLKANRPPGAVVCSDGMPFFGNLENRLTENYIQRCFTHWSEIADLLAVKKDPVFTVKMVAYKLLPTLRYRLHLQQAIAGFTNSDVYFGFIPGDTGESPSDHGLFTLLSEKVNGGRKESISTLYLKRMIGQLRSADIPFYYWPPPVQADGENRVRTTMARFQKLQPEYDNLRVLDTLFQVYPADRFRDGAHLNALGLEEYHRFMTPRMRPLVEGARRDAVERAFHSGESVSAFASGDLRYRLHPIRDVTIRDLGDRHDLEATGPDPAVSVRGLNPHAGYRTIVRVLMTAPAETVAKIYYPVEGVDGYAEKNTCRQDVQPGFNELFFELPGPWSDGTVRFDPGEVPGPYILHAFEAKIVPNGS